jgi:hypothetical protein
MSQRNRHTWAAVALLAAILLAAPAPTFAAGLPEGRLPLAGAWEHAWSWLAGLVLPGGGISPGLTARWEREGSAIDPNGQTHPASAPAPPTTSITLKPDGTK